jgi:hypothetical protein
MIDGVARGIRSMGRQLGLLTLVSAVACGGISTGTGNGEMSGGTPAGGAASAGTGASGARAGVSGAATGGAAIGAGGTLAVGGDTPNGGTPVVTAGYGGADPMACSGGQRLPIPNDWCRGIKTGLDCVPQEQLCPCLPCGLADLGTRSCSCSAGIWSCSACQFPEGWRWPANVPLCTNQADKVACGAEGQACEGAPAGEVCLCYRDSEGSLLWDCDKPPAMAPSLPY